MVQRARKPAAKKPPLVSRLGNGYSHNPGYQAGGCAHGTILPSWASRLSAWWRTDGDGGMDVRLSNRVWVAYLHSHIRGDVSRRPKRHVHIDLHCPMCAACGECCRVPLHTGGCIPNSLTVLRKKQPAPDSESKSRNPAKLPFSRPGELRLSLTSRHAGSAPFSSKIA